MPGSPPTSSRWLFLWADVGAGLAGGSRWTGLEGAGEPSGGSRWVGWGRQRSGWGGPGWGEPVGRVVMRPGHRGEPPVGWGEPAGPAHDAKSPKSHGSVFNSGLTALWAVKSPRNGHSPVPWGFDGLRGCEIPIELSVWTFWGIGVGSHGLTTNPARPQTRLTPYPARPLFI